MPRVSVVIPCYNSGKYIRQTTDSALDQDFEDLDVIIVDDGSTDENTLSELESLSALPRVMLVRQANSGPSAARNIGILLSSAEYFLPLDADDIVEPQYVGQAVNILDANSQIGAVYCRADLIGDTVGTWNLPDFDWSTILVHNLVFNACLFRRSEWVSVGGYDETMRAGREDHDYILKILGLGRSVWRLEDTLFHYRQHGDSRNAAIGASREELVAASAQIFRNNSNLYSEKAEQLFEFIYRQHDEISDLRNRYATFEKIRKKYPLALKGAKAMVRLPRFIRGRML